MNRQNTKRILASTVVVLLTGGPAASEAGLVGHWKLTGDAKDSSGLGNHGVNHGVDLAAPDGAGFDGLDDYIEVSDAESLRFGRNDFSIAVWIHAEDVLDDVLGDILSKYDPRGRTGITLSIQNHAGVTSAQSNYRNLFFGIDAGRIDPKWTDCGRPGNNLMVWSLTVYDGNLYAATFETGKDEAGHVYRYAGGAKWVHCGSPHNCNAVTSLAVYDGKLYAGVARYRAGGSALPDSVNQNPGGKIYRYDGGTRWTDCGQIGDSDTVFGLVVYGGKLYATTMYARGKGLYRYEGGTKWTFCGNPGKRVTALAPYNGELYATGWDKGEFFRYDGGTKWTNLGRPGETSQIYSIAIHSGRMFIGTWPGGTVFRHGGGEKWINQGRLGSEKEVMGMVVYNGKLYAGTLPLAEVYRYDGGTTWTRTGQLDTTPDVKYRRAWSMAVYKGKLFCGTLPSGHVFSLEAGKAVTYDHALKPGWRHVVAVRAADKLKLYVDGNPVAASLPLYPVDYDLSNDKPLKIGFGPHDYFNGKIKDLRIYDHALTDADVRDAHKKR